MRTQHSKLAIAGERLLLRAIRIRSWLMLRQFTAGSVAIIRDDGGRLLLVRPRYRLDWGLPGGLLSRRERADHALRREISEEVGLELTDVFGPIVYVQSTFKHIEHLYTATAAAGGSPLKLSSLEIKDVRWFDMDDLPSLQPEAVEALHRVGLTLSDRDDDASG